MKRYFGIKAFMRKAEVKVMYLLLGVISLRGPSLGVFLLLHLGLFPFQPHNGRRAPARPPEWCSRTPGPTPNRDERLNGRSGSGQVPVCGR